jgi:hypothetical protein
MSKSLTELIQEFDVVGTMEESLLIQKEIAELGDSAVPSLLQYTRELYRKPGKYIGVLNILRMIGYPANRGAIPFMVTHASRINASGWEIAIEVLKEIGEPIIPEVHAAFEFYVRDVYNYRIEIQGLCILLEQMSSSKIDAILPDLLLLLEFGTDENHVDEYALAVIRKIGSPEADVAIPYLGKIISSRREKRIRKKSIDALTNFDISAIRFLRPILEKCLSDPEDEIHHSAKSVLNRLGEV